MLVSAIIPTYNRARTIGSTLESVLSQTWKELEVIVVDDGSTDDTAAVVAGYGDRVRLIRQRNQGPSVARNTGIKASKGEIVSFLDSDDSWLPEKTARQVNLMQRTAGFGVECCVCNARMVYATQTINSFDVADLRPESPEGVWTNPAQVLMDRFLFFNQVVAVRRELLERTGYFREDLRIMEDYDMAMRLSLSGPWGYIAEPLVIWQGGAENSLSQGVSQVDACLQTFQILNDLKSSSQWGPLLPKHLLHRRMRVLKHRGVAFQLSGQSRPLNRWLGKLLMIYLQMYEKIYWRLPTTPRMSVRPA
ncbi:glycosyltransferase family 2 protein [Pedosphaera parvula]|uniref:Glycosyl transferase family 2 n=1 Tax=Pedosphaera parvula (strain Ellin514) TaxID=320771 RepID=B9XD27_PEDPL|nr:glycosyltransferase [Pedosphaera parvula]EEF62373.1 glycosyl transferase family 2 [Pedosphaera parvula Ellin514]